MGEPIENLDAVLRLMFERSPDALFVFDDNGVLLAANPAGEALVGLPAKELIGARIAALFDTAGTKITDRLSNYFSHGSDGGQAAFTRPDGTAKVVEYASRQLGPNLHFTTARDITERKAAEAKLIDSEDRFAAFMRNLPGAAFIKSLDGRHVYVNVQADLGNFDGRSSAIGKTDEDIFPAEVAAKFRANDRMVIEGEQAIQVVERTKIGGEVRDWLSTKFPIRSQDGKVAFVGGVALDITERLRMEDMLRESKIRLQWLSRQLIDGQEGERRRIARELHDEVGQALTALKLSIHSAQHSTAPVERLNASMELIDRVWNDLRELALELRPSALDELGLVAALEGHVKRHTQKAGISIHLNAQMPARRLSREIETACFRIAQEAVTNVIRHSGARRVDISLLLRKDEIEMLIEDDGTGFNVEQCLAEAAGGRSLGLLGMQERAQLLGGRVDMESTNQGTSVRVRLPVLEQ